MTAVTELRKDIRLVPGDGLLHSVPITAVALLIINDHLLKAAFPGPITGKISDFAGLIFFPLFLQGVWEVASALVGHANLADRRTLFTSVLGTGLMFGSMKLLPAANELWIATLGVFGPVAIALDPTDLVALPALLVPIALGLRRSRDLGR